MARSRLPAWHRISPGQEWTVSRAITWRNRVLKPGSRFPKEEATTRRLRQLYDQQRIVPAQSAQAQPDRPAAPPPEPAVHRVPLVVSHRGRGRYAVLKEDGQPVHDGLLDEIDARALAARLGDVE